MNRDARERMQQREDFEAALAGVSEGIDAETDVLYNDPADGLIAASKVVDLLVMGSRGRGPRRATVLGSVSRKVAEQCACPVVILPRGTGEASEELFSHVGAAGTD
jgi:nucleotide-binding universal stress UspA family protein